MKERNFFFVSFLFVQSVTVCSAFVSSSSSSTVVVVVIVSIVWLVAFEYKKKKRKEKTLLPQQAWGRKRAPCLYTVCLFHIQAYIHSQRSQRQRERYIALSPFARRSFSLAVVVVYFVCCAFHLKKIKLWSKRKSSNFVCREKYKTNIIFTVLSLSIDKTHLIKFIIWYLLFYTSTKHTN